ncbi:TPA: hypothetical protein V0L87_001534 [Streptococcus pneumoniae]|nr:hypothetical protein [Streptococcus pneumoniae]
METKTMSFRDTIILAMSEEMRRDENVFLMGEDVGVFGGDFGTSVGMLEEFGPERVRDCPISEAAISGAAAGAAMTGLRPIVDAHKTSGYIGEISAIISESEAFDYLDAPIRRCAGEDVPMPYAQNLENAMIPTVESIKDAIRKTYNKE